MVPCLWVATAASCLLLLAFAEIQFADGIGTLGNATSPWLRVRCARLIAVLGAKRPQDRGWQWVVASLWLVVVWPAAQALANPAGPNVEIFAPWKIFIVGLIAMGPLNYLPTRHSLAALLVAGGQIVLFGSFLGIERARRLATNSVNMLRRRRAPCCGETPHAVLNRRNTSRTCEQMAGLSRCLRSVLGIANHAAGQRNSSTSPLAGALSLVGL